MFLRTWECIPEFLQHIVQEGKKGIISPVSLTLAIPKRVLITQLLGDVLGWFLEEGLCGGNWGPKAFSPLFHQQQIHFT